MTERDLHKPIIGTEYDVSDRAVIASLLAPFILAIVAVVIGRLF